MPWLVHDADIPDIARKSRLVVGFFYLVVPPVTLALEFLFLVLVGPPPFPGHGWELIWAGLLLPNLATVFLAALYVGAWLRHLVLAVLIMGGEALMVSTLLATADPQAGFSWMGGTMYLAMGSLPIYLVGIAMCMTISAARRAYQ